MRQKYRRGIDMVDKTSRYIGLGLLLLMAALVLIPQGSAAALDGASIYANKCQTCHGDLATHNMITDGITADQITTSFSSGGMIGKGVTLATGEAQAIADAITPPAAPTTPTDPIPTIPTDPTPTVGESPYQVGNLAISAPEDITMAATGTFTRVADLGTPTVTGGTPPYTTINDAPIGGNFAVGETIVTWTATDSDGKTAKDTQKVTITGETTGGKISGKVLDGLESSDLGISGMSVDLIGIGKSTIGVHMRTVTDAEGNYQFSNLPPGRYIVYSKFKGGWIPTTRTNKIIDLKDGETLTVNFCKKRFITEGGISENDLDKKKSTTEDGKEVNTKSCKTREDGEVSTANIDETESITKDKKASTANIDNTESITKDEKAVKSNQYETKVDAKTLIANFHKTKRTKE